MAKPGATGITRIIHATNYSMKGLSSAWRHEAAFRQELLLIVLLMPLGRVRISTLRNENETFSQLNSITYIGVFLRLVTYSHLP